MPDMGKVHIRIICNKEVVLGVQVKSTRPPAYRLLIGRLPENAVQLVPLLYSICSKAQQAASFAATSAAQGNIVLPMNEFAPEVRIRGKPLWELIRPFWNMFCVALESVFRPLAEEVALAVQFVKLFMPAPVSK